jgi:hypothetical protein
VRDSARSPTHWVLVALAPACLLVLFVLGALVEPAPEGHGTHTQLGLPPCPAMNWLGVPCPGCGVTTSVALAARGSVRAAFLTQPIGLAVALGLALYPLWVLVQLLRGRDLDASLRSLPARPIFIASGVALLGAWIYKLAVVLG